MSSSLLRPLPLSCLFSTCSVPTRCTPSTTSPVQQVDRETLLGVDGGGGWGEVGSLGGSSAVLPSAQVCTGRCRQRPPPLPPDEAPPPDEFPPLPSTYLPPPLTHRHWPHTDWHPHYGGLPVYWALQVQRMRLRPGGRVWLSGMPGRRPGKPWESSVCVA